MDFKKATRLISPLLVEGLLSVRKSSNNRLIEMLHQLDFSTRSIKDIEGQIVIELQILDPDLLYLLLAGEANKFLLASRVSLARSMQDQPKNASWQAVENYYSAYYAVHYLLRLTGQSLTNIEAQGVSSILRSYYSSVKAPSIPAGLYFMEYDDNSKILILKKIKKSGGSHQTAWQLWEALVDKIKAQAENDPTEYTETAISFSEHKRLLVKSTAKYNPPEIRGEINYQFKGGTWIFEKNSAKSIGYLQRSIAGEIPISLAATASLTLIASNKLIIDLAKEVFSYASNKYPKSICRSILNQYDSYI